MSLNLLQYVHFIVQGKNMFNQLSDKLSKTLKKITGQTKLTEKNIEDALREVRIALLEADVALPVAKQFIEKVKEAAIGQEINHKLNPGEAFIKIVHDELVIVLGSDHQEIDLNRKAPIIMMMAGLQGSGKTTTTGKLAKYFKEEHKKSVMVVSCDIYRPAAIDQLKTVSEQVDVTWFPSTTSDDPVAIAKNAVDAAQKGMHDILLIDTAGRLHIDEEMMTEAKNISSAVNPAEIFFVVDSMTGQDAANTAKAFNDALPLTGIILTKTDGDARGGAALSMREITGKPIKFMGTAEKMDGLEAFHPDRVASRILGMGDIVSLVEDIERNTDKKKAEKLAKKIKKGKGFDLNDFKEQMQQMNNMGGMAGILSKLPGAGQIPDAAKAQMDDSVFKKLTAIINSMTSKERTHPNIISGSRKRRIAKGSGTEIQDVNRLLKQHEKMQKMMKKMAKPGAMKQMMRGLQGKIPPGMM